MPRTSSPPELLLGLHREAGEPLHAQLERQLRAAIQGGRLAAGARLPSSRALAAELAISRGVVVEAYGQLAAEGYLRVRPGAAPAVAPVAPPPGAGRAAPAPAAPLYDLRPGTPDLALFPRAAWAAAARRALRNAHDADLAYPDPAGHPVLRATLAAYLGRVRGVQTAPEQLVVCGGVAQALTLIARALHIRGARRIALEDPCHADTRPLLAHAGLQPVPVPVDADGIVVDALGDVDAVLVTPAHQFPTGVVLSPARRAALVRWARDTGALVIEDDYDAEQRYDRQPVGAIQGLAPDAVAHVASVSKSLAPGLRLGWAALPPALAAAVAEEKRLADLGAPVLEQLTLATFLERGELDRHLRRVRPLYRRRRDALLAALGGLEARGVAAGLHALVPLPPGTSEAAVTAAAADRGVAVQPLAPHATAPWPPALLLGWARLPEPAVPEAARRLRAAIDSAR